MSLRIQIEGVNAFLEAVYGSGTRSSTILASLGCTPEQLQLIRERHMPALTARFVAQIAERVRPYYGGERRYRILARRLGLDGESPATLVTLAEELNISRERVRQLQAGTLGRCRSRSGCVYFQESLLANAAALLAEDGIVLPPFDPIRATAISLQAATMMARSEPAADSESAAQDPAPVAVVPLALTPIAPEGPVVAAATVQHLAIVGELRETLEAIYRAAGTDIPNRLLAYLLGGDTGTVVEALVEHYHLQFAHGAFGAIRHTHLKAMVREARGHPSPRVASVVHPYAEAGHPPAPHAPDREEIRAMANAVRASVAHRLGDAMCGHILFGSHGPVVDALLATYAPPHYGELRALGIKRVMELLKDVRTNPVRE